jgi:hypothetical protein
MYFKLVCGVSVPVSPRPENEGYDYSRVVAALEQHSTQGDTYKVVNTARMTPDERYTIYNEATPAAMRKRYRIGRVFGSNEHPGEDFGGGVPALLVYLNKTDPNPTDVFPHEHKDGRLVTIAAYLGLA